MYRKDNTILLVSIGACMAAGYFLGQKFLNLDWGLGVGLVVGIVLGTVVNFYLGRS